MPNWCSNEIDIHPVDDSKEAKKQFAELLELLEVSIEDGTIGGNILNKLVPMPESLRITSGTSTDYGMAVVLFTEHDDDSGLNKIKDYPWAKGMSSEDLCTYLVEKKSADIEKGRQAISNIKNYGYKSWYEWSIANWGTKWDTGDDIQVNNVSEDCLSLYFSTAWSPPTRAFANSFNEKFDKLYIELEYTEPGCAFEGTFIMEHGEESDDQREYDCSQDEDNCLYCSSEDCKKRKQEYEG